MYRSSVYLRGAEQGMTRQDFLLQAVYSISTGLAAAQPKQYDRAVVSSLQLVAQTAGINRAIVWRNANQEDKAYCRRMYSWESSLSDTIAVRTIDYDNLPHWKPMMRIGKPINCVVAQMPQEEQVTWQSQNVHAILAIPIIHNNEPWGFVEFSRVDETRAFDRHEEEFLRACAMIIISGILRNESGASLIKAKQSALDNLRIKSRVLSKMHRNLRDSVNRVVGLMTIAQESHDLERVHRCLQKTDDALMQVINLSAEMAELSALDTAKLENIQRECDADQLLEHVIHVITDNTEEESAKPADDGEAFPRFGQWDGDFPEDYLDLVEKELDLDYASSIGDCCPQQAHHEKFRRDVAQYLDTTPVG